MKTTHEFEDDDLDRLADKVVERLRAQYPWGQYRYDPFLAPYQPYWQVIPYHPPHYYPWVTGSGSSTTTGTFTSWNQTPEEQ